MKIETLEIAGLRGVLEALRLRGIVAYAKITAPLYWWYDLETYRIGHERLFSESTMHGECKGLYGEELQRVKGAILLVMSIRRWITYVMR